jgi:hypothetical protein
MGNGTLHNFSRSDFDVVAASKPTFIDGLGAIPFSNPLPTLGHGYGDGTGFVDPARLSVGPSSLPLNSGMSRVDGSQTVTDLPSATLLDTSPEEFLLPFTQNWDTFGHVFDWGLGDDTELDFGLTNSLFDTSGMGPVSSTENLSAAWLLAATPRGGSPVDGVEADQRQDPFGRKHDNPWVGDSPQ